MATTSPRQDTTFEVSVDPETLLTQGVHLYGRNLLDPEGPINNELAVNGRALSMRRRRDPHDQTRELWHLKGEHWVDHLTGWSLVLSRRQGARANLTFPCWGIQTTVRRERCDHTQPIPGPGGPPIEAPLYIDTLSLLNWRWRFWDQDTRMIFTSGHSNGPSDAFGHCGHENDHPKAAKAYLQNPYRRIYPGNMMVHGGLFYDAASTNWLAITCRRPHVGYQLNIDDAGDGISYDFTLHSQFDMNEVLRLPEIRLYYGPDRETMMRWLATYVTHYYESPPAWVHRTVFRNGLAWDNAPTWAEQADVWQREHAGGTFTGISYSLVTDRPIKSGTTPLSYQPDPNHGSVSEFKAMCLRMDELGIPMFTWMSHSGLAYRGSDEIDDDWFIRGIDGGICASWGNIDQPELAHINPGHPGYIEYTRKWIRFYVGECRCKGIFIDCFGWALPSDFRPRTFMRYPGDTNRMAVRFMEAVYEEIKACNPEAILLGEGWGSDLPVNVFSIHANPVHSDGPGGGDGMGPRDFLLHLNQWSPKRLCIDQGPRLFGAAGFVVAARGDSWADHNRMMVTLLKDHGRADAWHHLPGDVSIMPADHRGGAPGLVVVPVYSDQRAVDVVLPPPWSEVSQLHETVRGTVVNATQSGRFPQLPPGIYAM